MSEGGFIFISYGREPQTDTFVKQLKTDLDAAGFKAWIDICDIPAGSDWHGAIGTAVQNCSAMIAVITQKYTASRYCTNELYQANGDGKPIYPVFRQDVDFSVTESARGVKYVISGINWTMFRPDIDDYDASLAKLIGGLKEKCVIAGNLSSKLSQMQISPAQHTGVPHLQSPQQYGQPPPSTYPFVPPPFAPQYLHSPYPNPTTPPMGPPYGSPIPPVGVSYSSPVQQGYPNQPYPMPIPYYGQQSPQPVWPSPQGQQLQGYYPGVPSPHGPLPNQPPPPPTYHQIFGHSKAEQFPEKHVQGIDSPDVAAAGAPKEFKVGMRVEAVDRRFPYFVCVATIADVRNKGSEVLVHFDGWTAAYDYWCGSDAIELHPVGWCESYGWELQEPRGSVKFQWNSYLKELDAEAAPKSIFKKHQLDGPGSLYFKAGMRVEAKDRKNPALICVATIAEVRNRRLLVHFDGWSDKYDYWCSPDTVDIHPAMWCGKNGKKVQAPKGYPGHFQWNVYLNDSAINPAPAHIFTSDQIEAFSIFKPGMKLEAKDRLNPLLTCVATVADVRNQQVLIHFDGWSDQYDYWCSTNSTDVHPAGWCSKYGYDLQPPNGYDKSFNWNSYLSSCKATRAPENIFTKEQIAKQKQSAKVASPSKASYQHGSSALFRVGMKVEAKDRQYPTLICVATIIDTRGNEVLIHFDNWSSSYDYWCKTTSTDIHPIGWCKRRNHTLQPPNGYARRFTWESYLAECDAEQVPDNAFTSDQRD